jgi:hypothetical protein
MIKEIKIEINAKIYVKKFIFKILNIKYTPFKIILQLCIIKSL